MGNFSAMIICVEDIAFKISHKNLRKYYNLGLLIMQKIYVNSWLNMKNSAFGVIQTADNEIKLDFSQVDNIALNDIECLLDLQKMAVFNGLKLSVENMQPQVSRLFEQTGLYKLLSFGNSAKHSIRKRQGLAFD